jgi:hypothetical protein
MRFNDEELSSSFKLLESRDKKIESRDNLLKSKSKTKLI